MAGPGFLNFRLGDKWFGDTVACVEREGADYGSSDTLARARSIMVEFVSANPTGPMHMGNARGGVLGDTLAERACSSPAQTSGASSMSTTRATRSRSSPRVIEARYLQIIKGEDAVEFPEDGYHGDDIQRAGAGRSMSSRARSYLDCDRGGAATTRHGALRP